MFRRIFVPLDGSPFSMTAVPVAIDRARRAGGSVHLAIVTEPPPQAPGEPPLDPSFLRAMHADHRRFLDRVLAREGNHGIPVTGEVLEGPAVSTLLAAIRAHSSGLVVMASHGRGGFSRFWLGSTALGLVRGSPAPILLLRLAEGAAAPFRPRRVLLPLDGTGFGDEVIWQALALAGTEEVEYLLVRVIAAVPAVLSAALPLHDEARHARREHEAADYLAGVRASLESRGATVRTEILDGEAPGPRLVEFIESEQPDLVAMATHGRSAVGRLLLGSVADKVVRGTGVPVLLQGPAG